MRKKNPRKKTKPKNPQNHIKEIMFPKTAMLMTLHLKYIYSESPPYFEGMELGLQSWFKIQEQ